MAPLNADQETTIISTFVAIESVAVFSAFLPSVFTIDAFAKDQRSSQKLREGEIYATLYALALMVITSLLLQSSRPLLFGLITITFMLFVYERAIKDASGKFAPQ